MVIGTRQFNPLQIEVRKNGQLVETHTLPVTYKNHLRFLSVQDSWGHELLPELADTTDDQSVDA